VSSVLDFSLILIINFMLLLLGEFCRRSLTAHMYQIMSGLDIFFITSASTGLLLSCKSLNSREIGQIGANLSL